MTRFPAGRKGGGASHQRGESPSPTRAVVKVFYKRAPSINLETPPQPSSAKPLSNLRTLGAIAPSNFRTLKPQRGLSIRRLYGFRRQRRHKKWRRRRRTSPAGTVSQPIGKPFNGQAKGPLWLTWRSYAGPPQSIYLPRARARSPPVRRSRSQAEPWQPRAERPGGWLNPHARTGVSTFGNSGKQRAGPGPDLDRATGASNFRTFAP